VNVVNRLRSMLPCVVQLQDRLETRTVPQETIRSCMAVIPAMRWLARRYHRIGQALGYLPSLVGELPHHGIIAAHEVIDELAAEGRDEGRRFAQDARRERVPACRWRLFAARK